MRSCGGAAAPLALIVGLAALATYHLIVRAGDVLVTLVGGFGPVMLPLWVLAFIVLSPVPLMICLAGTVGVVSARASAETRPAVVWRSIAARLGTLWLWLAGCYVVMLTPSLLFSLSGVMLDRATDLAMTVALDLIWTVALTVAGMVGCVVLVEPGQSLPRAWRLLSPIPVIGLAAATLALVVLPELANMTWGAVGLTVTSACCDLLWAVAALVTYAQARGRIEPVAGPAPHDEPATPEAVPVD
ncbi:hypothetical protein ACFQFC_07740 [Amorphoplanes digitatis]|uniref:hypothetical protein n=1 Tax=Actinoplanes digitatis TaxID=1868 RepID=UPI00360E3D42